MGFITLDYKQFGVHFLFTSLHRFIQFYITSCKRERDHGVNLQGLGCACVLNRLLNGLDIYPFTQMI